MNVPTGDLHCVHLNCFDLWDNGWIWWWCSACPWSQTGSPPYQLPTTKKCCGHFNISTTKKILLNLYCWLLCIPYSEHLKFLCPQRNQTIKYRMDVYLFLHSTSSNLYIWFNTLLFLNEKSSNNKIESLVQHMKTSPVPYNPGVREIVSLYLLGWPVLPASRSQPSPFPMPTILSLNIRPGDIKPYPPLSSFVKVSFFYPIFNGKT